MRASGEDEGISNDSGRASSLGAGGDASASSRRDSIFSKGRRLSAHVVEKVDATATAVSSLYHASSYVAQVSLLSICCAIPSALVVFFSLSWQISHLADVYFSESTPQSLRPAIFGEDTAYVNMTILPFNPGTRESYFTPSKVLPLPWFNHPHFYYAVGTFVTPGLVSAALFKVERKRSLSVLIVLSLAISQLYTWLLNSRYALEEEVSSHPPKLQYTTLLLLTLSVMISLVAVRQSRARRRVSPRLLLDHYAVVACNLFSRFLPRKLPRQEL